VRLCHIDGLEEMVVAKQSREILRFALMGAEERLRQISAEAQAIHRNFPQLRSGKRPSNASFLSDGRNEVVSAGLGDGARERKESSGGRGLRRRRTMSAEARRRISDAQKARWAKQKAEIANDGGIRARSSKKK
jgi:hypothetical protein